MDDFEKYLISKIEANFTSKHVRSALINVHEEYKKFRARQPVLVNYTPPPAAEFLVATMNSEGDLVDLGRATPEGLYQTLADVFGED